MPSATFVKPSESALVQLNTLHQDLVHFDLPREKAFVLYALVSKLNSQNDIKVDHFAQKKVLWDLESILQGAIPEFAENDFGSKVKEAYEETWPTNFS